ncbi:MAG TPA: sigma-54 dependent transcriptional regulator [Gemmataceae bacterium]|nr:sigma-54 dependent transcriptional regulator [Gemmataceae bacterium]
MPTLLVVDDEPSILLAFRRAFGALTVLTAETAAEGLDLAAAQRPDAVVLDIQLPDLTGLEALQRLRDLDPRCPVIFITGKSTTDTAIEAMKLGAYDYLLKPLELKQLRQVVDRALALRRLMHVPAVVADAGPVDDRADAIVGRCPAMQAVYKAIGRVAAQDVTVLITGESGTGKELVARALYQHSRRADRPFLAINCAAIPEALLESELFGHEPGAFTGADRRRIGKFEQAHGGTVFLDEVGDMAPATQAKVLRVLQDGRFERLGGGETVHADVRILAATNHDLDALVKQGKFREDLYYRLSVFAIHLPPLRERGDDVNLLVQHYLRRFNRELGRFVEGVSLEALELLRRYPWPGNVRELQSVLKQALLQATGSVLLPDFLPAALHADEARTPSPAGSQLDPFIDERLRAGTENLYEEALCRMERVLLTRVLQHTGGNQVQAARLLGITRGSLRNKIRELGITIARSVHGGAEEA